MSKFNKKAISIAMFLTMAVSLFVVPAQAQVATDIQAQINQLLAQIQVLQAQLAAAQGTGAPAVTFNWTRDLTIGSTGEDVKALQQFLNRQGFALATTGPGSAGNETSFFGPLTRAAVIRFQTKNAITPANGVVGSSTRAILAAAVTLPTAPVTPPTAPVTPPVAPAERAEGSLTVIAAASPASNANVTTTTNVPIYGIQVRAIGSQMTVERVDLRLRVTRGTPAVVVNPATLIRELAVYDGTTLLTERVIRTADILREDGHDYVRLSGFRFNVPRNETRVLTIKANFHENLETDRNLVVSVHGDNGIRAVDTMGLNSWAKLDISRNFTVKYATVGESVLRATANIDTPASTSIKVDSTHGATNVEMFRFNLRSTVGASKVTEIPIIVTGADGDVAGKVSVVKLYDGATLLGSVAPTGSGNIRTATFTDLEINIARDTTKTLTAKVDFAVLGTTDIGDTVTLSVNPTAIDYEQPDLSTVAATGTPITGNVMRVFSDAIATFAIATPINITYDAIEGTDAPNSTATGVITFRVTADGGTLTKLTSGDITVQLVPAAGGTPAIADVTSKAVAVSPDRDIADGSTATVTVTATATRGATPRGLAFFRISEIDWRMDGATTPVSQTWGLEDFKTGNVNMR